MKPLCPYFGSCGGCSHQHLSYEEELSLKEENLKRRLQKEFALPENIFQPIVPSPTPYSYRSRLDLSLRRSRGEIQLGFMAEGTRRMIAIDTCAIARSEISSFLPALKLEASAMLPDSYRSANLVVKTDQSGKLRWGGIGPRSLRVPEESYFWTEIEGRKIFYSLDTFFQVNLGILPRLMEILRPLLELTPETHLLDLYSGVGLFWVVFATEAKAVWAVEESASSMRVAEFNRRTHGFSQVFLKEGRTEDCLDEILAEIAGKPQAAIVDPPRKGLNPEALEKLKRAKSLSPLIYISCNPDALVRDLEGFLEAGWQTDRVVPFDFFPRTRHLEVAVRLYPGSRNQRHV